MRFIAFLLPQFHPIPENNAWWGPGFTEWTFVSQARPLFEDHYQPHVPADLGFYDLRLPETRQEQARLAADHGIEAFCYWHYWFEGKRLLERPFDEVLRSGDPDFPFCLAWANEPWSRRWHGEERDVLQPQTYSPNDDVAHARWLVEAFRDPRYLRVADRPLFLIYRPLDLPNPAGTAEVLRRECRLAGFPRPFLLGIDAHCPGTDCTEHGLDGTVVFEPQLSALPGALSEPASKGRIRGLRRSGRSSPHIYAYEDAVRLMRVFVDRPPDAFPTALVSWDNTPRRGTDGIVLTGCTPDAFREHLRETTRAVAGRPKEERLVFLNAWNEWAEGNHLEPDRRNGRGFLEVVQSAASTARVGN